MPEHRFPLKDRREVCDGTMAFWFDTAGQHFSFEAGQNIDLYLPDAPATGATTDQMHTFSFASSPTHGDSFMVTTRMRPSVFKNTLKTLPLGTPFRCVGPNGNMVLHEDLAKPAVFLAGGIGITPFRSMAEWATVTSSGHDIFLMYSNRTLALTAFHDDFMAWAKLNPRLHYHPTLTDEQPVGWPYELGKIDVPMLQKLLGDITRPVFYLAGPDAMVMAMRSMLTSAGVSRDNIRLEAFSGY